MFRKSLAKSLSGHVWLYRQGRVRGERSYTILLAALFNANDLLASENWNEREIQERGRIIECGEVKRRERESD